MGRDERRGVWSSGRTGGRGRTTPKGRQVEDAALEEICALLGQQPRRRDLLIEFLHLVQDTYGHLSARHLRALAAEMDLSMAEVWEVATFYAHFDPVREGEAPPPDLTIRVCNSLSCELAGSEALYQALLAGHDPAQVRVLRAPCMGRCETAPVVEVGHRHVPHATENAVNRVIGSGDYHPEMPDYETFATYRAGGGYEKLEALRATGDWQAVQDMLMDAGLRGMGGAGFPSGKKWGFVRDAEGPRYLAVNGDEGEPGTFKDRYHLERTPHMMLEGMLIAAWAVEAETCFVYIRDEYAAVLEILRREIAELERAGLVAPGYIDLRRGAGAYICGEESAMIESIEGKRGIPRLRPPYVAQRGVFGRPTLVHNVETLHFVARICREGPEITSEVSRNARSGLRSYSVSGRVAKPGVYVLPSGSTILDVIDAAGGMAEGHTLKAFQPGGPSSGLLPANLDYVPLDFETLTAQGTLIGSAAVVILSDKDSARDAALNMLKFFEAESCGQCTPCRVGCEKAVKLMQHDTWDRGLLEDLCLVMEDASICGLGQAAPNPIRLVLKHFADEV
ncbi:NAD(P)H-dependent oxidoreductase subunit E [Tropicimonas isoalkanivorans]|uniref:NAD-dependent formate dehydrogenase flavoprotein subunit n=1 Tax=Tropicimonas isoalkanivorans TaxID=441112 RepID=A0A1I1DBR7_9RHOB|nr:NAD(P)H-dependent oxidoreductase subunit E [Tropicimonas isoalkanivorans]SFB72371.1 NAD-dependent formate dehydrogenase flavoprotein subunit [Tropicimonas isoalkanivorans]